MHWTRFSESKLSKFNKKTTYWKNPIQVSLLCLLPTRQMTSRCGRDFLKAASQASKPSRILTSSSALVLTIPPTPLLPPPLSSSDAGAFDESLPLQRTGLSGRESRCCQHTSTIVDCWKCAGWLMLASTVHSNSFKAPLGMLRNMQTTFEINYAKRTVNRRWCNQERWTTQNVQHFVRARTWMPA